MKNISENYIKNIFLFITIASSTLIGVGYGIAGSLYGVIVILILIVLIFFSIKFNWKWAFTIYLISHTILATIGILAGVPSFLMIAGVATTLASWELSNIEEHNNKLYPDDLSVIYEKKRMLLLFIAIGSGMIVAEIILFIQFQLPFVIIFSLAMIILFCFFQMTQLLDLTK